MYIMLHTQKKMRVRERGAGGGISSPWGRGFHCVVQYCISTIQNSIGHTVSAFLSQLLLKLCCIKNKERKSAAYKSKHLLFAPGSLGLQQPGFTLPSPASLSWAWLQAESQIRVIFMSSQ